MIRTILRLSTLSLILTACAHSSGNDEHNESSATDEHGHEGDIIHFSEQQMKAAGLKVETIKPSDFSETLRVSGQVMAAQGDEAAIVAKSSGVITFTRDHLSEGVSVQSGESLAYISAAGMEGGDGIAMSNVNLRAAKAAYERGMKLYSDTIISKKELERLHQEYEAAKIATGNTTSTNKTNGSSVKSPLSGYIKTILVKQGEYVTVGQAIATVTKSCNLQLRAEIPEKYFSKMHTIRSANFEMSYGGTYSLDDLHGRIVSMGKMASEGSSYIPMTFEFENRGNIVPGAFADIWLLGNKRPIILSVPNQSLTEEQGVYYVYIQLDDPDEFEKREVTIGSTDGRRTEILSGIKAGDKVVTNGVYQVKLASGNVAPEAHNHSH